MYKVLKQLQTDIKASITDALSIPLYINRVPEENSKKVSIAIRWQENSTEITAQLDDANDKSQIMELYLFSDTSNNDADNNATLEAIQDYLKDYVYFGDYSIMDVSLTNDTGYIGIDRTTTNSIYVNEFKVTYGS